MAPKMYGGSGRSAVRFVISDFRRARVVGAMGTAVRDAIGYDSVSNHAAFAVAARRRQNVNRALEAVEGMLLSVLADQQRAVVVVATDFAGGHGIVRLKCAEDL